MYLITYISMTKSVLQGKSC